MARADIHDIYKLVVNDETWKDEYDLDPESKLKDFNLTDNEKENIKRMLKLF